MSLDTREWYTSTNPDELLQAARPLEKVTERFAPARERRWERYQNRRRLFGCACARMVWDFLPTDAQSAVAISEEFAYGWVTGDNLRAAAVRLSDGAVSVRQHALAAAGWASMRVDVRAPIGAEPIGQTWRPTDAARSAAKALAARAAGRAPPGGNPVAKVWEDTYNHTFSETRAHQAELVRDIFPPPGYTPVLRPDWRTSTVLALARQMDETGDFSAVPILADALQDAGCDNEIMLDRCRAPSGIHCRGNWVVDLILGRE